MSVQIFPVAGGTASFNGVFIPVANLLSGGISGAAEFADSEAANVKRDKGLFAIAEISTDYLASRITAGTLLGVNVGTPNKQSLSWAYSYTLQTYELRNGTAPLAPLPVPTTGTNNGVGDFALTEIFPGAEIKSDGVPVAGAGILIELAPLYRHGSPTYVALSQNPENFSVDGDCREFLHAFFRWMASSSEVPARTATVASAVTAKTASAPIIFNLPTAATAATNPTTGLTAANLDISVFVSFTSSITFNLATSEPNPVITAEINSVVS